MTVTAWLIWASIGIICYPLADMIDHKYKKKPFVWKPSRIIGYILVGSLLGGILVLLLVFHLFVLAITPKDYKPKEDR